MRVLVTGHNGYIGSVMVPVLCRAGHDVVGLDSYLFEQCGFGDDDEAGVPAIRKDVRDVEPEDFEGFDAVIHLAALSNDPLGNLNPECTYEVNHAGSLRVGRAAKQAGVRRFVFASSCSLYGIGGDGFLTEQASFNPITPYGRSKVLVERDLGQLADDRFSPTYMRNATAYGVSPRLRMDLVVNSFVALACTAGQVRIESDGTPWRPLVHVEDICRAFAAVLEAPLDLVRDEAFNVGRSEENCQIRDVAEMVRQVVPGSGVSYAEGGGPDPRCYRVDCGKIARVLPAFKPQWTLRRGIEQLHAAYKRYGLTLEDAVGSRYFRMKHISRLQREGRLDDRQRWRTTVRDAAAGVPKAALETAVTPG